MEIIISNEEGSKPLTVFQVEGMLNQGSYGQLEQAVKESLAHGMQYLLIDLSNTTSLTSAGLRSLLTIHRMMAEKWPSTDKDAPVLQSMYIKLYNPKPDIRRILKISGFDQHFEIFDNRQEAIFSF
ncbi:MAG: STAS domain-containing protein [Anaerolineales bacterium]|nr:STAS domain-containing protein [Anaerolineales bacterium]